VSCICPAQAAECNKAFGSKTTDWGYGKHMCEAFDGHNMADLVDKVKSMGWCVFCSAYTRALARMARPRIKPHVLPPRSRATTKPSTWRCSNSTQW